MAFDVSFIYRIQDRYTPQLKKIQAATSQFGRRLGDLSARSLRGVARGMGSVIAKGGAFIGALGLGSVALSANSYSIAADKLAKLSKSVGESANTLAGWQHAAELSGLSAGQMDKAIQRLFRNVGDFKSGTGELTTLLKDSPVFADMLRDATGLEDQFYLVVGALQDIQDPAQRAAAAAKFFGERVGPQMIPLLNEGTEGIKKMAAEWKRHHGGFDPEQLAQAELYRDELGRLQLSLVGLRDVVGAAVMPKMTELVTTFKDWILEARESGSLIADIRRWFSELSTTIQSIPWSDIMTGAKEISKDIWNAAKAVNAIVEKTIGWKNAIVGLVAILLGAPIIGALAAIITGVIAIGAPILGVFGTVATAILGLISIKAVIVGVIGAAIGSAVALIVDNWDAVKAYFGGFVDWFGSLFEGMGEKIGSIISTLAAPFRSLFDFVLGGFDNVAAGMAKVGAILGFDTTKPNQESLPTASNPSPLSDGRIAVAVSVAGQIGIAVTGPGQVTSSDLQSDAPGNLGFNLGMAGAG